MSGLGLTFLRRGNLAHPTAGSDYIKFKDEAVFNILMSKGVSSDGVGITKDDALKVTDISSWFAKNAEITSFDEFQYFNNVLFIDGAKSNWDYRGFINCSALKSISLPEGIKINNGGWVNIKGGAFVGSAVENIGNLDKVSYIGDYAFRYVVTLSWEGVFNSNITKIGTEAFLECANFNAQLILPNLQTLGDYAFHGSGVTKVLNLGSITKVSGSYPAGGPFGHFRKCNNLTTIVLPETLTQIGDYAISSCPNLSEVICKSATPPTLSSNGLSWSGSSFVVYVPDANVADYHAASTWSNYTSRIKGISQLATDNPSLYEEIKEYL